MYVFKYERCLLKEWAEKLNSSSGFLLFAMQKKITVELSKS